MVRKLTQDECRYAIENGEFSSELLRTADRIAIVLTQSWCPQWLWMRSYLNAVTSKGDIAIFWLEYDREAFFEEFLAFKENTLGNREVPYVRYYLGGRLSRESNYVDKGGFLARL